MVVPTPFKLLKAVMACSRLGSLRKAFFVSAITARGVFTFTRQFSCGQNLPRCNTNTTVKPYTYQQQGYQVIPLKAKHFNIGTLLLETQIIVIQKKSQLGYIFTQVKIDRVSISNGYHFPSMSMGRQQISSVLVIPQTNYCKYVLYTYKTLSLLSKEKVVNSGA